MRSKQRLEANPPTKRSTGPTTEPGKARSKMNALKHGLSAKAVVIKGEDPREFEALRAGLEQEFGAPTVIDRELVENLAVLLWRQRRGHRFEAAIIQNILDDVLYSESDKIAELGNGLIGNDILTKLARYETNLANRISRTINQLLQLRAACGEADERIRLIESAIRPEENSSEDRPADSSTAVDERAT